MSDEEHHFESRRRCLQRPTLSKPATFKVVEVSTSKTGKHGHAKCHFVGIDIFTAKKLEDIVPSSHNCDVPHANRTDYQLIDISEDGFVRLLTDNGNTKDDLRLPTDDSLLTQRKEGFAEGKDLAVSVTTRWGGTKELTQLFLRTHNFQIGRSTWLGPRSGWSRAFK